MSVRFEADINNLMTNESIGVFSALTDLIEGGKIDSVNEVEAQNILSWFIKNLLSPTTLKLEEDKFYGTCWFKKDAIDHIEKAQAICIILNKLGVTTTIKWSEQLDNVIYSDTNQVVVRTLLSDVPRS